MITIKIYVKSSKSNIIPFKGKKLMVSYSNSIPKIGDRSNGRFMNALYPMECIDVVKNIDDNGQEFYSAVFRKIDKNGNFLSDEYDETRHFIVRSVNASVSAKRRNVFASSASESRMYVEDNNGGRDILLSLGGKWYYFKIDGRMFGDIDIYSGSIESVARKLRQAMDNGQIYDLDEYEGQSDDELDYYGLERVPEYDGHTIDDIDWQVNYNSDGTPMGHDETTWVEV